MASRRSPRHNALPPDENPPIEASTALKVKLPARPPRKTLTSAHAIDEGDHSTFDAEEGPSFGSFSDQDNLGDEDDEVVILTPSPPSPPHRQLLNDDIADQIEAEEDVDDFEAA